ncbi:hypothetical protein [Gimesia fumaroli]|nr:hypothetical protein [Gimesia fumaroli]
MKNIESTFYTYTGKEWPNDSVLLSIGDTRNPDSFRGGGAYHLIFKADSKTIKSWLNTQPPWSIESWQSGPVPTKIQYNFNNFSNSNSIWHNPDYKITSLSPDRLQNPQIAKTENLLRLTKTDSESPSAPYRSHNNMEELQSSNIKYVASNLGNNWVEGKLFAINTQNNIVFLSVWDIVR